MMGGIGIQIDVRDGITPALRRVADGLSAPRLKGAVGPGVARLTRAHLTVLDHARPNRLGGRRSHFYAAAAKRTRYEATGAGVDVVIAAQGIAQRYFGGTIEPVKRKYLAIPARAEAYGVSPLQFGRPLALLWSWRQRRPIGLVAAADYELEIKRGPRKGQTRIAPMGKPGTLGAGGVLYWLVKGVVQEPDPTVLPTEAAYGGAVRVALESLWRRLTRGGPSAAGAASE